MLKKAFVFCLLAMSLIGCGREFAVNAATLTGSLALLDSQYEQTAAMLKNRADEFSQAEREQLRFADQRIQQLRAAAHALIADSGGVAAAVVKADQVRLLYESAKVAYSTARYVVCPDAPIEDLISPANCERILGLPGHEQLMLIDFDFQARRARNSLVGILESPDGADITQAISDVLAIGATAARVTRLGLI